MAQKPTTGSKLIIVCGLPGAGKTTQAIALEEELGAVRFCSDEWMQALSLPLHDEGSRAKIEALQWAQAQRLLALGQTVIIEWGTWGRSERDTLRLGARALGAAVELRYLSASVDILFQRVQRRGMEDPPLTLQDLQRSYEAFQSPTAEEIALFDAYFDAVPEEVVKDVFEEPLGRLLVAEGVARIIGFDPVEETITRWIS